MLVQFFFLIRVINTDRKSFEIFFPESLWFSGMGRDDDLGHFRFFRIIIEELRLIEDLKEGHLVLIPQNYETRRSDRLLRVW